MKNMMFPTLPEGREYMAIGPNVWGRNADAHKAVSIAKREFSGRSWKFILYDVPAGAWVDEMGFNIEWKIPEGKTAADIVPTREILRYVPKEVSR